MRKACNFWVSKGVLIEKQSPLLSVNADEVVFQTVLVLVKNVQDEE